MTESEYPLIDALHAAYRAAVETVLASGEPVHLKYTDVLDTVTGGSAEAYIALCSQLVRREFDDARMYISFPPYLQARKRFVDALGAWINRMSMETSTVFEIAELIGGPEFDVERTTYGEAWSLIRGDTTTWTTTEAPRGPTGAPRTSRKGPTP